MIKVETIERSELRMGSPLKWASAKLTGTDWQPHLINLNCFVFGGAAVSDDGWVALGSWEPVGGPQFVVYMLDTKNRKIYVSPRIKDAMESLEIIGPNKVRVKLYRDFEPEKSIELEVNLPVKEIFY